jgi:hypothetical protein
MPSQRRPTCRTSRIDRLLQAGLTGAAVDDDGLTYTMGSGTQKDDEAMQRITKLHLLPGWFVHMKRRKPSSVPHSHAPLEDLAIHIPGIRQPFKSGAQLRRHVAKSQMR